MESISQVGQTVMVTSHRRRGVFFMVTGSGFIVANDALIKFASESMPLSQLMFVRGCFGTAFLLALAYFMRTPLRATGLMHSRVLARAGLDVTATVLYVIGLASLPLANVTAITMTSPLIVTFLAILVYGEEVNAVRWLAISAGFAGVLLIVQPASDNFSAWSLLILLSTTLIACRDVVTRSLGKEISSLVLTLIATLLVTIGAGAWGIGQNWQPLGLRQLGVLAIASMFLSSGYVLVTIAMREAQMGVVAPFKYSALIVSSIITYVVWDHIPNYVAWCGIALTVVAGIYLVRGK